MQDRDERQARNSLAQRKGERVKGIEPSYAAWEAAVLPLNYTRVQDVRIVDWGLRIGKLRRYCQEMTSSFDAAEFLSPAPPVRLLPSDHAMVPARSFGVAPAFAEYGF